MPCLIVWQQSVWKYSTTQKESDTVRKYILLYFDCVRWFVFNVQGFPAGDGGDNTKDIYWCSEETENIKYVKAMDAFYAKYFAGTKK